MPSIALAQSASLTTTVNGYRGWDFIDVEWTTVSGASGYDVRYRSTNSHIWHAAATNATGTSLRLPGIPNYWHYIVGVQAVNSYGGCDLDLDTTYFLVATASGNAAYQWLYSIDSLDTYTANPSDNGWSIGKNWYSDYSNDARGDWTTWNDGGKFEVRFQPK